MDRIVEAKGKTTEEAIEIALKELGVGRNEVEIEVLSEGSEEAREPSGPREARVKVIARDRSATEIKGFLENVFREMGIEATVSLSGGEEALELDVEGNNLGILIGRHGRTLEALQYLLNIVASRISGGRRRVILDVAGYRQRRKREIEALAKGSAEKAIAKGAPVALEPMSPFERRIVHLALGDWPDVETRSEGEGPDRRVVIIPKQES